MPGPTGAHARQQHHSLCCQAHSRSSRLSVCIRAGVGKIRSVTRDLVTASGAPVGSNGQLQHALAAFAAGPALTLSTEWVCSSHVAEHNVQQPSYDRAASRSIGKVQQRRQQQEEAHFMSPNAADTNFVQQRVCVLQGRPLSKTQLFENPAAPGADAPNAQIEDLQPRQQVQQLLPHQPLVQPMQQQQRRDQHAAFSAVQQSSAMQQHRGTLQQHRPMQQRQQRRWQQQRQQPRVEEQQQQQNRQQQRHQWQQQQQQPLPGYASAWSQPSAKSELVSVANGTQPYQLARHMYLRVKQHVNDQVQPSNSSSKSSSQITLACTSSTSLHIALQAVGLAAQQAANLQQPWQLLLQPQLVHNALQSTADGRVGAAVYHLQLFWVPLQPTVSSGGNKPARAVPQQQQQQARMQQAGSHAQQQWHSGRQQPQQQQLQWQPCSKTQQRLWQQPQQQRQQQPQPPAQQQLIMYKQSQSEPPPPAVACAQGAANSKVVDADTLTAHVFICDPVVCHHVSSKGANGGNGSNILDCLSVDNLSWKVFALLRGHWPAGLAFETPAGALLAVRALVRARRHLAAIALDLLIAVDLTAAPQDSTATAAAFQKQGPSKASRLQQPATADVNLWAVGCPALQSSHVQKQQRAESVQVSSVEQWLKQQAGERRIQRQMLVQQQQAHEQQRQQQARQQLDHQQRQQQQQNAWAASNNQQANVPINSGSNGAKQQQQQLQLQESAQPLQQVATHHVLDMYSSRQQPTTSTSAVCRTATDIVVDADVHASNGVSSTALHAGVGNGCTGSSSSQHGWPLAIDSPLVVA